MSAASACLSKGFPHRLRPLLRLTFSHETTEKVCGMVHGEAASSRNSPPKRKCFHLELAS